MPDGSASRPEAPRPPGLEPREPCLGRVVEIDGEGRPRVSFPGLAGPPPVARVIGHVPRSRLEEARVAGRSILLAFLDGRADAPVIMSLASAAETAEPSQPEAPKKPSRDIELEVDGQARVIEASEELVLRCGEASISLSADGTVKILGRDLTSWARRRHRIRGGSVAIN